jgi:hypothetical protein
MSSGSPVEVGTPIRYPSSALFCVNSADAEVFNPQGFRIDSTNPGNIYINKQAPVMFGYMTRVALTEVNIEWSFPNVYEGNNSLTLQLFNLSGVSLGYIRVTVPVGFYTAPALAKALQDALNSNATVIASYPANSFHIGVGRRPVITDVSSLAGETVEVDSSRFVIELYTGVSTDVGYFRIMPYNAVISGLARLTDDLTNMMGLTPTVPQGSGYYDFFEGGFASMLRTPYIDIVSGLLTKNQNVRDNDSSKTGSKSLLARVYLSNEEAIPRRITLTYSATESPPSSGLYPIVDSTDNAFGVKETTFRREFKYPKQIMWNSTENIDVIDLQVVDYKGNIIRYQPTVTTSEGGTTLEQNNTSDFQFTMMVSEV